MTTAPWPCWAKAWQFAHFKLCGSFFSLSRAFSAPGSLDIFFSDDAQRVFFSSLARSGLCYVFFRRCNAQRSASPFSRHRPVKTTKNLSRRRGAVNIFRARHQQCRSNEELRCVQIALQTRVHGDIQSGRRRHAQAFARVLRESRGWGFWQCRG